MLDQLLRSTVGAARTSAVTVPLTAAAAKATTATTAARDLNEASRQGLLGEAGPKLSRLATSPRRSRR
jgi:hypothetical protein